jgi:hypothetical protein
MNQAVMDFVIANLSPAEAAGARILEVGSYDVNGGVRSHVQGLRPQSYWGVDMRMGPGVDQELQAQDLVETLGKQQYDIVISTEMLEHVVDWRASLAAMMEVLVDGGLLILTTVTPGFPYHGYPEDHWRFQETDLRQIMHAAGFGVTKLATNPAEYGICVKARRPLNWKLPPGAWDGIDLGRAIIPNPFVVHLFPRGVYVGVTRFQSNETLAAYLGREEVVQLWAALDTWLQNQPINNSEPAKEETCPIASS